MFRISDFGLRIWLWFMESPHSMFDDNQKIIIAAAAPISPAHARSADLPIGPAQIFLYTVNTVNAVLPPLSKNVR